MNSIPLRSILNQPLPPVPPSDPADNVWRPPSSPGGSRGPPQLPTARHPPSFKNANHAASLDESAAPGPVTKPRSRTIGEPSSLVPPLDEGDYEITDFNPPSHPTLAKSGVVGLSPVPERSEAVSSAEIGGLKASMKFLQSLVEAMQENTQKEFKSLRGDVVDLQATVEDLQKQNQELQAQIEVLGKRGNPSPLGNWINW